ncbi:LamB [Photobacterium gaetbulicola]|uniref:LamB n=1 Tax=Photobacterium gaetbulicola TaxID=1295392 RepID=A0A0B9GA23_9GAMM|nr:carbohydrate porin [Photobacterium gaetbulicola]KHT65588.1 LamB [Photobacterium gaetbulicola]
MKNMKMLPLSVVIGATLVCQMAVADETDANVIAQVGAEESVFFDEKQPQTLSPEMDIPEGIVFSGYARYGAHFAAGDKRYVQVGSTGAAVGRLGNETNGGEFQLAKAFQTELGAIWDVVVMIDHWASDQWDSPGGLNLVKAYAGVTNIIPSQPQMYFWGGRDFHQRPQQNLNDYFWMQHDGQGGGFRNLDFGGAMFDLSFVAQVDKGESGLLGNDNGVYAVTSKLHDINGGVGRLDFYANYGFASDEAETDKHDETAWQVAAVMNFDWSSKLIVRYTDGGDDSVFDLAGDKQVLYTSYDGFYQISEPVELEYLASYKRISGDDVDKKNEYSAIVRPMYRWDDVHSTWLEAGYAKEDFDNGDELSGWKLTLSQNISMGGMSSSRPMLRFYATAGEVDNQSADSVKFDTLSLGAMFEAWW